MADTETSLINRYKLKDGYAFDDICRNGIEKEGGIAIENGTRLFIYRMLNHSTSLVMTVPKDLEGWNDFDYILVLDEVSNLPLFSFYMYMEDHTILDADPYLEEIIVAYNTMLDGIEFLERKH